MKSVNFSLSLTLLISIGVTSCGPVSISNPTALNSPTSALPTVKETARPVSTVSNPTVVPSPTSVEGIPTPVGPIPWNTVCNLPPSVGSCIHSTAGGPSGRGINSMTRVMDEVSALHPEYFEKKGTWACQYKLKKAYTNAYYLAWLHQIEIDFEGDVCAQWDGDQLNVKYTNAFSESYHPIRFDGDFPPTQCLSDKDGIYSYSCVPAGF